MRPVLTFPSSAHVSLRGPLGQALDASLDGHLVHFIQDESSPAIALFCPEHVAHNREGDWYGEHAGKWLYAAARAVERTGDERVRKNLQRVSAYLVSRQEPDGYLGTYAPERRFMCRQGPAPRSWDGAPAKRTWDIWVHSYLILGLLEAGRVLSEPACVQAARRIGDLCWRTFAEERIAITSLGNHFGLSATVLLDPAVELFRVTGEPRYLELAKLIAREASESPALELLPQALAGTDAAAIATGKSYQLCWNLVGLAKLHRATGEAPYLEATLRLWENIREFHLTLGGGPWGGVAHRSREVFNPQTVFSPYGYVETCATFAWIQLNRELHALSGEARFAEEIEKAAYNDLLGAQAPAGDNWCYYSFPNGRRVFTTYWRCCKSSGPMALEDLPSIAYAQDETGFRVNLYGPSTANLALAQGAVIVRQTTNYPFDGEITFELEPEREMEFAVALRVPSWAGAEFAATLNGAATHLARDERGYATLHRRWRRGDILRLQLGVKPVVHRRVSRNVQESRAPDGSPVAQEVMRYDYAAITRGPLVYATTLIDGFKREETLRLPPDPQFVELPPPEGAQGPALRLDLGYRPPLIFQPYFEAGGRADGTWRLTWMQTDGV